MDVTKVSGTAAVSQQSTAVSRQSQAKPTGTSQTSLAEMIKDAQEKIQAHKDSLKISKNPRRYGDAPIEAYSRLSRAKTVAQVNAASGYARRQLLQLKAAKRQDPDNAKQIQAAINQLQKAVNRSGKKRRELEREKVSEKRQARLREEQRSREAQRELAELRRKKTMRMMRESGYIREAEVDKRMQGYLASTQAELRNQAQALSAALQPPAGAAEQYAAPAADVAAAGGELDIQV